MKFNRSKWRLRNWLQLSIFLLTTGSGIQFYFFVRQAAGDGPLTIARPPGVEGFLPIGALMGWKQFFLTGHWDNIHHTGSPAFPHLNFE